MADDLTGELVARLKVLHPEYADIPDDVLAASIFHTTNARDAGGAPSVAEALSPWTKAATIGASPEDVARSQQRAAGGEPLMAPYHAPTLRAATRGEQIQDAEHAALSWLAATLPGTVGDALGLTSFRSHAAALEHPAGIAVGMLPPPEWGGEVGPSVGAAAEAPLDLSRAAQTQRAAAQGFTVDALHGRSGDYEAVAIPSWKRSADAGAVGEGFYASPATEQGADIAGWYASQAGPRENLMPVKLKLENPLRIPGIPGDDPRPAAMRQLSKEWGLKEQPRFSGSKQLNPDWAAEFSDALRARGFDGVVTDLGSVKEYMVLSPQQVRSRFAAFDPRQLANPNLVAGIGGGAVLLSQVAPPDRAE
jgi:hypothetical protein